MGQDTTYPDNNNEPADSPHETAISENSNGSYWACRRNPSWKSGGVVYTECKTLMEWNPRDEWLQDSQYFDDSLQKEFEKCFQKSMGELIQDPVEKR